MSKRNNRKIIMIVLAIALAATSVAYAALQTTLSISGTVTKKGGTWNIYFANVSNPTLTGSTTMAKPSISTSTNLSFSTTLAKPLDAATFTVDVVNGGSIDAALSSVVLTGVNEAKAQDITYAITYLDGTEIKKYDTLTSGQTRTIKVTVSYDNVSSLSSQNVTLDLGLTMIYAQASQVITESGGGTNVPSVDDLEEEYEFKYFNSLNDAVVAVNNGTIDDSANGVQGVAPVGVYIDESDKPCVVLLNDVTIDNKLTPTVDMTINLGGHTLKSNDTVGIESTVGNLTIDGTLAGSEIRIEHDDGTIVHAVEIRGSSSVTVVGGTYISSGNMSTKTSVAFDLYDTAQLTISDAVVKSYETNKKAAAIALRAAGATATISNCDLRGYSNYTEDYTAAAFGIFNFGTVTVNNSYVSGNHSGVNNQGTLYINGGTYEGYGHGGFYLAGNGKTSYIQNAIIRESDMPEGYTDLGAGTNRAAFYVGGASGMDNLSIYVDSCILQGSDQVFALRSSAGEKNNKVYISNSTINTDAKIRIDSDTHHLYIGTGNNFTADNTTLPGAVTTTNEVYTLAAQS